MVILEGMLYGLAIAASSVGGPAEILDDERTGILFPAKDAAALAEAILRLIRELRHRVGESGAREVREKWLWPPIAGKMYGVYSDLVRQGICGSLPARQSAQTTAAPELAARRTATLRNCRDIEGVVESNQFDLWTVSDVIFHFREGPRRFRGNFEEILRSDGYGACARVGGAGITHPVGGHTRGASFLTPLISTPKIRTAMARSGGQRHWEILSRLAATRSDPETIFVRAISDGIDKTL